MPRKKAKKSYIIIPGDDISAEELFDRLDRERLADMKFEMERIRTSDMSEEKKQIARSKIEWRMDALKEQIRGRC